MSFILGNSKFRLILVHDWRVCLHIIIRRTCGTSRRNYVFIWHNKGRRKLGRVAPIFLSNLKQLIKDGGHWNSFLPP